ncbi:MAG TPA: hypothetical protein P5056_02890 [Candidatus Paceibacterota bacterium]|nr:hypothetical protein [Candidatus Paceibacterota bacterium]
MEVRSNATKWATRSAAAGSDYASGVQTPRRSWAAATAASEGNYEAGVNAAIARKAYGKGISNAGDATWQKGVAEKGRTRYQQGVSVSSDNYSRGFQPFADTLRSVTLAPRGPKGQNFGRVQQVGEALRAKKLQA